MIDNFIGYKCSLCGNEFGPDDIVYTCPDDGGNLDVILNFDLIRQTTSIDEVLHSSNQSLWRYLPLLPVRDPGFEETPLKAAGWTPVFSSRWLSSHLGINQLWVKDESRNPTASFKDRASAIVGPGWQRRSGRKPLSLHHAPHRQRRSPSC
jgi:threonine synthase